jgi:hemerythrin superfamily protein
VDADLDGFEVLEHDHRRIQHLFARYHEGPDDVTVRDICEALTEHAAREDHALYPLLRKHVDDGDDLADVAEQEHAAIKLIIERIELAPPGDLSEPVREMHRLVDAHFTDEEQRLFPMMREAGVDSDELGRRVGDSGRGQAA